MSRIKFSQPTTMIHYFEELIPDGWVYPCSLKDIQAHLATVPPDDLDGLWAVGLAASTRKDRWANGRYWSGDKPRICLYSYPASLEYRQPAQTKRVDMEWGQWVETKFGMTIRQEGNRWACHWSLEDLRRFMLEHVLMHEIGHHVFYQQRAKQGIVGKVSKRVSEQFAEDYALRHAREHCIRL